MCLPFKNVKWARLQRANEDFKECHPVVRVEFIYVESSQ